MKILFALIALALLIGAVMFGTLEIEKLDKAKKELDEATLTVVVPEDCNLQKSGCYFQIEKIGNFELTISPRPIEMNTKIKIKLVTDSKSFNKVEVDFLGKEMNMGYNRPLLKKNDEKTYIGESLLPRCVTPKMTWQSTVIIYTDDKTYGVPFEFVTVKK